MVGICTQGAYKNDLLGLEFEPMMPGQPKLTGEYIITDMMGLSLSHSKWLDLAMIFVLLFSYRLTFFLVLKVKEYASPYIRVAYTRFTVKRLERRASFRKTLAMTSLSKRHNPPHPMAIQEGDEQRTRRQTTVAVEYHNYYLWMCLHICLFIR
jgi:hypothetical protein